MNGKYWVWKNLLQEVRKCWAQLVLHGGTVSCAIGTMSCPSDHQKPTVFLDTTNFKRKHIGIATTNLFILTFSVFHSTMHESIQFIFDSIFSSHQSYQAHHIFLIMPICKKNNVYIRQCIDPTKFNIPKVYLLKWWFGNMYLLLQITVSFRVSKVRFQGYSTSC